MSEPKSLREVLTEHGVLGGEASPRVRLVSARCELCGQLQHQLVPHDRAVVPCLMCKNPLRWWRP
jgi:hypothetical protein